MRIKVKNRRWRETNPWNCVATRHGELNYSVTSRQALSVSVIRATSPLLIDGRVRVMGDESRFHDFNKSYVMFRVVLLDNSDWRFVVFNIWSTDLILWDLRILEYKNRSEMILEIEYNEMKFELLRWFINSSY